MTLADDQKHTQLEPCGGSPRWVLRVWEIVTYDIVTLADDQTHTHLERKFTYDASLRTYPLARRFYVYFPPPLQVFICLVWFHLTPPLPHAPPPIRRSARGRSSGCRSAALAAAGGRPGCWERGYLRYFNIINVTLSFRRSLVISLHP